MLTDEQLAIRVKKGSLSMPYSLAFVRAEGSLREIRNQTDAEAAAESGDKASAAPSSNAFRHS